MDMFGGGRTTTTAKKKKEDTALLDKISCNHKSMDMHVAEQEFVLTLPNSVTNHKQLAFKQSPVRDKIVN